MPRNTRPFESVHPYNLSNNFRYSKYYYDNFVGGQGPISWVTGATNSHPVAPLATGGVADGELDQGVALNGLFPGGAYWQAFATTALSNNPWIPTAAQGLNIGGDILDNEAVEHTPGGNAAKSRFAMVVGTDTDFFLRARLKIVDVSGIDQLVVGWRKQEAYAVPVSFLTTGDALYTDYAGFLFQNGDVKTTTDINNAGSAVVTDTLFNVADNDIVDVELRVVGGKAIYLINANRIGNPIAKDGDGTAITSQTTVSGAAYTFTAALTLVPMIFVRHDATTPGAIYLREIELGHLVDVGLDPNVE